MNLPDYVQIAIRLLEESGYEAVVVGGAVRDYLLNQKPNDYDISTNALPDEAKLVFQKYYTLDTGIKHGTISLFINHHQVEITTYRNEEDYEDYRHPKKVIFVNKLEMDLVRRDFTINAICFNHRLIDLVGGIEDINNKIIRAIGDPKKRFTEDPLRILRALRFASTLGFTIEEETKKSMFNNVSLIDKVSKERINIEFNKLLTGQFADLVISEYHDIILFIIPELPIDNSRCIKTMKIIQNEIILKLAALFIDIKKEKTYNIMKRLKYSKLMINQVCFYVENFDIKLENDEQSIAKLLKAFTFQELNNLIDLKTSYCQAQYLDLTNLEAIKNTLKKIYQMQDCFRVKDLKISGNDLIKIGFHEGIKIRITLDNLLEEVIEGKLSNKREELLRRAKKAYMENKNK